MDNKERLSAAQNFINKKLQELRFEILYDDKLLFLSSITSIKVSCFENKSIKIKEKELPINVLLLELNAENGEVSEILIHMYEWTKDFGLNGKYILEYDEETELMDIKYKKLEEAESSMKKFLTMINYHQFLNSSNAMLQY